MVEASERQVRAGQDLGTLVRQIGDDAVAEE